MHTYNIHHGMAVLISLRLTSRTNYVIRVMRIKDKGDRKINSNNYTQIKSVVTSGQALHLLVQNSHEAYSPAKVYYLVQYLIMLYCYSLSLYYILSYNQNLTSILHTTCHVLCAWQQLNAKCIHGFYSFMQDSCTCMLYTIVTVGCSASTGC